VISSTWKAPLVRVTRNDDNQAMPDLIRSDSNPARKKKGIVFEWNYYRIGNSFGGLCNKLKNLFVATFNICNI